MTDKSGNDDAEKNAAADINVSDTTVDDGSDTEAPENTETVEKEEHIDTVQDLKLQLESMSDRYVRLMAEFDNFKKRVSRDYERLVETANERLMLDMIEVRENFDRALRSSDTGDENGSFFEGMKLIFNKFDSFLTKHGLEVFAAIGDAFDPQVHDAMMKTPHESIAEDHIAEIYEKGYSLKGRVIKHAKVIVSSGKAQENAKEL